jgi:hypothetical protein
LQAYQSYCFFSIFVDIDNFKINGIQSRRKDKVFKSIISYIENGASLRPVLRKDKMPSSQTFFIWLEQDENKSKQYVRATTTSR